MTGRAADPLSPSARDLLRAARVEALPPPSERARSLARLQALDRGLVPGPVRVSGDRGVVRARLRPTVKVLLAVAAVLVTAASAAAVRRVIVSSVVRDGTQTSTPLPDVRSAASSPVRAMPAESHAPIPPPVSSAAPSSPKGERPPRATPPVEQVDELTLLGNARQALAAHQGAQALRWLDEDRRRFPGSPFLEERAYTRIRALCELRRNAEASSEAARFLRRWPASVYAPGARRGCSSPDEGTTR